jgi:hypothetical protein
MHYLLNLGVPILAGLIAVTAIDILGSIASRKYRFIYAKLTPLSFAVYTLIGFSLGINLDFISTICGTILVGLYDATIGLYFSKRFRANFGEHEDRIKNMSQNQAIGIMVGTCLISGAIGFAFSLALQ